MSDRISPKDISGYSERHGVKATQRLLSILGRRSRFVEAFESELGQMLLYDAVKNADLLLDKIIDEEASSEEKAEYRAYRNILQTWTSRIIQYQNGINQLIDKEEETNA